MVTKVAFLFPGQGSQSVGMGKRAAELSPRAKALFTKADALLGYSLSQLMFEGPEDKLRETTVTQPALFLSSAAALELLKGQGIEASWAAGHSLGEYSALYSAGVLSFEDALRLVQERGRAMQEAATAQKGTMAAVIGLAPEKLKAVCEAAQSIGPCVFANFNSESQIVISGNVEAVRAAMRQATEAGAAKVVELSVSGAFHSPLMKPAADKMKSIIDATVFADARLPVFTNIDAKPTTSKDDFRSKLVAQITGSVLWDETLKGIMAAGAETFIEVGSGKVLSSFVRKLDRKRVMLATDDFESIQKTVAAASVN